MTKPISDYTVDELSAKIEAIKTERERTANALKRYEEELERRKQEVPLGVPLDDATNPNISGAYHFGFTSEMSRFVFSSRLNDYVKALQKLARGEQIDIKALLPLLRKGWVATDENGDWFWYKCKPLKETNCWNSRGNPMLILSMFNIKPADNWETSLMECGL